MGNKCTVVTFIFILVFGLSVFGVCLGLGIWYLNTSEAGEYYMTRGICYTWEAEVYSYYDSNLETDNYRAQWRVDIYENITGTNDTVVDTYYDKISLGDTSTGGWGYMEDAYDLLDQWDVGQNYSCWFNPYKIIDYPGTLSEDYEEYAFFKYDPDDMGGNDLTISIICFIVAGLAFISTVFGLVICYISRD